MTTQQDIDTVTKSLTRLLVIANSKPNGGEENYRALAKAHEAAGEAWFKSEAIPLATAALSLIGGAFVNLERIASALEAPSE
jgi:hypothetical protein